MINFLPFVQRIYNSISFLTLCITFGFGLLAFVLMIISPGFLDGYPKLAITDPESIKFILSFTIGGVFTLTVFSYTMVMDVLNRSIGNYSPRLVPLILRDKYHQVILGVTSGTIIYSLIMAIFISSKGFSEFPALAAPLAILMGICSILLFIYFIHSVSQTIQVNYVLGKSFHNTRVQISQLKSLPFTKIRMDRDTTHWKTTITMERCGYLNKIRLKKLVSISGKERVEFKLLKKMGSFVMENEPVLAVSKVPGKSLTRKIKRCISIDRAEAIEVVEVGFKHLVEVAVKASSPAINDPGTALTAIDYLTQLFVLRKQILEFDAVKSDKGGLLFFDLIPWEELAEYCFLEMETYMKDDPILMKRIGQSKAMIYGRRS
ncbi:MAG TPA: DUF2254 family protein [Pricia sp.]|nr:DUF2254 family protein [Pricia sp.]